MVSDWSLCFVLTKRVLLKSYFLYIKCNDSLSVIFVHFQTPASTKKVYMFTIITFSSEWLFLISLTWLLIFSGHVSLLTFDDTCMEQEVISCHQRVTFYFCAFWVLVASLLLFVLHFCCCALTWFFFLQHTGWDIQRAYVYVNFVTKVWVIPYDSVLYCCCSHPIAWNHS